MTLHHPVRSSGKPLVASPLTQSINVERAIVPAWRNLGGLLCPGEHLAGENVGRSTYTTKIPSNIKIRFWRDRRKSISRWSFTCWRAFIC